MSFGFLFVISILAGIIGALSGMSGGVLLIPVLTSFGIDIKYAIAMSVVSVISVSSSAALTYVRRHLPNLRGAAFLEVFAVFGALSGTWLALIFKTRFLFFLCGGAVILSIIPFLRKDELSWKPAAQQDPFSKWVGFDGSYYDYAEERTIVYQGKNALWGGVCLFGAGIVSGFLGIGGSAFTVLVHHWVMGFPPKVSVTMSSLIIGVMALASASIFLEAGFIKPGLAAPVILGIPLGAWVGSRWLVYLNNRTVRILFSIVLVALGLQMIIHGFRKI